MSNENTKILFGFQQLVRSNTQFRNAENDIRNLRNSLEDAVYRAKESGELLDNEFEQYKEIEKLLFQVKEYTEEMQSRIERRKCKVGYELENILSGDEN
jgi:hypothetical protein